MSKGAKSEGCCPAPPEELRVEAIVSVDERGQMVLPKDIREKLGLRPGEKLAVVTREREGRVCCVYMFRTDELAGMVREKLGPLLLDVVEAKEA
jgi:AbrB family looped-hinge helix DNA binding protein